METKLIATLVDKITGPANKAAHALKGISNATNSRVGGVFSGINRELGRTNRQLDQVRGRMVEAVAQVYVLQKALSAPIMAAVKFDTQLVDIGQVAGKSRIEIRKFGDELLDLSPKVHLSADKLAESMKILTAAGMDFETASKSLPAIGKVVHTFNADVGDVSNATMALITNLKVPVSKLPDTLAMMASAANKGKFELKDMAKEYSNVAALAAMRGMRGPEAALETSAALEVLAARAGSGAEASTHLQNVLQKMTSTDTANKFDKAIGDFGINIEGAMHKAVKITRTARGKIKKEGGEFDLAGTVEKRARERNISQLRAYLSLVQEIQAKSGGKVRLTDLIADKEYLLGVTNLIDGMKEWNQIIAETRKDYKGFMDEQQGKRLESWQSKLDDLSNSLAALNTTIGNALAPMLDGVTEKMQSLTAWVKNLASANPALIQNTALAATAFVGLNVAVVALKYSFLNLKVAALASFNVMRFFVATPLGFTLMMIANAVMAIYTNWDKIKQLMPGVAKAVENAVNWMKQNWFELPGKVWEVAVSIRDKLLGTDWIQVGRDMIAGLWSGMKEWLNKILAGVGDFVGKVKGLFVGSASASTGGSATSMSGATGGSGGGGYTAAAERMRRLSGGGASGATPSSGRGGGATPSASGGATPNIAGRGGTLDRMLAGSGGGFNVRGVKNMNPGNIAYGPWARAHGAIGSAGRDTGHGVAVFPSHAAGAAALEALALGKYSGGKRSIDALIAGKGGWTPGNHQAAANVARMMGISPHADARLSDKAMMRKFRNALMVQELGPGGARHVIGKLAGRARGGPVHAGQSYVVGEQGWEIFKPRQSGQIVNQKQLAAEGRNAGHGGNHVTFHATFNITGATDAAHVARTIKNEVRSLFRGSHSDLGFAPT